MPTNLSDVAILNIKGSDYCCIIILISKNEAINLMQNADLAKKKRNIKHKNLLSHIKMGKEILTFGGIEIEKNKFYHHKTAISWAYIKPGTPEHGTTEHQQKTGTVAEHQQNTKTMAQLRNTGRTMERWQNNQNITEKRNKTKPVEQQNNKTTSRNTTNTEGRHN